MLDKNVFNQPEFIEYINANYYAVKFNAEGNETIDFEGKKYANPNFDPNKSGRNGTHEFTIKLKVRGYPSMYIFDINAQNSKVIVGYKSSEAILSELKNG